MDSTNPVIELIDKVLKSKKSKLSTKDRETLIIIREKLRKEKKKRGLLSLLKDLAKIVGVGAAFYKDS